MKEIYMKARAKINLNLEVLGKREDNYHNIESIFQKVNLYDEIYIKKIEKDCFELKTNIEELNNEENIVYKAYMKLKEIYKNITGVSVTINKKIPMQAGMAGGSTDCAKFILGMNKLFDLKLSKREMEDIGKSLGADVVPCFYNKAIKVEGIGDIITKINTNFKYYILIIKPKISCDTKKMYKQLDEKKSIIQFKNTNKIINALKGNNVRLLANNLYNVFEEAIQEKEEIRYLKENLMKNGALGSAMTGSGSCVYGIFENKEIAQKAFKTLNNNHEIYICTSYNSKKEEMF